MAISRPNTNYRLFWNTRKEMILAILLFTLSGMILWLGVLMQIKSIIQNLAEINNSKKELERFSQKANQLSQIVLDKTFRNAGEIDQVLPSHKPLLELLNNLNNVATVTQVIIRNFSLNPGDITENVQIKKSSNNQNYNYLDLNFSVSGKLSKIRDFLTMIEQVTPISTITSITINRDIDANPDTPAQAELVLRSFYFTQPIKTTITSPLPNLDDIDKRIISEINNLRPNDLPQQAEVIIGNRGNLFGLQNQDVVKLEKQLIQQQEQQDKIGEAEEKEVIREEGEN